GETTDPKVGENLDQLCSTPSVRLFVWESRLGALPSLRRASRNAACRQVLPQCLRAQGGGAARSPVQYRVMNCSKLSRSGALNRTAPSIGLPQCWQRGTPATCFLAWRSALRLAASLRFCSRCRSALQSSQVR